MSITLSVTSSDLDDDEIQELTQGLCNDLNNEVDEIQAELSEAEAKAGTKGDPITIGTIILTLIGSGGVAVSLINVLKIYVERGKEIKVKIKGENGDEVEIVGSNLSKGEIDKTASMVNKILGASK